MFSCLKKTKQVQRWTKKRQSKDRVQWRKTWIEIIQMESKSGKRWKHILITFSKLALLCIILQTSLIWWIRWICKKSGKKTNVQNALDVFHVWLLFCWHFSSVLINMETKLKLWLLVDFLPLFPPPPQLLSHPSSLIYFCIFLSYLFCEAFIPNFYIYF